MNNNHCLLQNYNFPVCTITNSLLRSKHGILCFFLIPHWSQLNGPTWRVLFLGQKIWRWRTSGKAQSLNSEKLCVVYIPFLWVNYTNSLSWQGGFFLGIMHPNSIPIRVRSRGEVATNYPDKLSFSQQWDLNQQKMNIKNLSANWFRCLIHVPIVDNSIFHELREGTPCCS